MAPGASHFAASRELAGAACAAGPEAADPGAEWTRETWAAWDPCWPDAAFRGKDSPLNIGRGFSNHGAMLGTRIEPRPCTPPLSLAGLSLHDASTLRFAGKTMKH